jgi:SAM-dependent MidA family methyltransferase
MSSLGNDESGIYGNTATQQANALMGLGTGQAGLYSQNTNQNMANNNTMLNATLPAIQSGDMAGQQASATSLNALLGGMGSLFKLGSIGTGGGGTIAGSAYNSLFG